MKNILLALKKVIVVLAIIVLVFSVLFLVFVSFSPLKTFQLLRVMSGSMEPAIKTGSVVFVEQVNPKELKMGDIITYSINNPISPITHRIVKIVQTGNNIKFVTKGDANKASDVDQVNQANIKGKVIFATPYIGYISAWTKSPLGFVLLIILPALLIIINEIFNIRRTVKDEVKKKIDEAKTPFGFSLFLLALVASLMIIKPTSAFFSDGKVLTGNVFSTGHWITPTPTPTSTPTVTPTITPTPTTTITPTPNCNDNITINQSNSSDTTTIINSSSGTGNNSIEGNSSGSATISTGNSQSTVTVTETGSTNSVNCSR